MYIMSPQEGCIEVILKAIRTSTRASRLTGYDTLPILNKVVLICSKLNFVRVPNMRRGKAQKTSSTSTSD